VGLWVGVVSLAQVAEDLRATDSVNRRSPLDIWLLILLPTRFASSSSSSFGSPPAFVKLANLRCDSTPKNGVLNPHSRIFKKKADLSQSTHKKLCSLAKLCFHPLVHSHSLAIVRITLEQWHNLGHPHGAWWRHLSP